MVPEVSNKTENRMQVHKLDSFWNSLFFYFYEVYLSSEYYSVLCISLCTVRAVKERRNLVNSENLKMNVNKVKQQSCQEQMKRQK